MSPVALRRAWVLLLLSLAAACGGAPEPEASEELLVLRLEHPGASLGLGLESFVEVFLEPGEEATRPPRFLDGAELSVHVEGGAELLWTEAHPEDSYGPYFYRVHFRCGVDAAAAQRLTVRLDFPHGPGLERSVALPCVAATHLLLVAPKHLVPGEQFLAQAELLAGTQQLLGRGITFADPAGPLLSLRAEAQQDFFVRAVRPGAEPRLRAGPLEVSVPVTVHEPETLAFSVKAGWLTYEGGEGLAFRGELHTAGGEPVQSARGCEVTVSPPSAERRSEHHGLCAVDTYLGAVEVCMTYGSQRRCERYDP